MIAEEGKATGPLPGKWLRGSSVGFRPLRVNRTNGTRGGSPRKDSLLGTLSEFGDAVNDLRPDPYRQIVRHALDQYEFAVGNTGVRI